MERNITILVIDDETAIRNSYRDYLEDLEYDVLSAGNGREGLEVFREEAPDLVVVDLRMPEVDGLEVLKAVKAESSKTPIIVVSGTGVINDVVEALHLGAWDYLLKPIEDFTVFRHAVENSLERASLLEQNRAYQDNLEEQVKARTAELSKALQEKEILLQEVHHRVKNNMAVISAFISLKEQLLVDREIHNMFQDLQQRIKTMAMVHEKLYKSDNFREISVRDYLRDLIDELLGNYSNRYKPIELKFDVENLYFDLDVLIPLGLIVNEIVINAIRHAFRDISGPVLSIRLVSDDSGNIELRISDNGPGFKAENIEPEQGHMGMQIINALAVQLGGSNELKTDQGTLYIIRFPAAN